MVRNLVGALVEIGRGDLPPAAAHEMLASRDRWIHDFVVGQQQDWDALRVQLERPFANAVRAALSHLSQLLDQIPGAREEGQV